MPGAGVAQTRCIYSLPELSILADLEIIPVKGRGEGIYLLEGKQYISTLRIR